MGCCSSLPANDHVTNAANAPHPPQTRAYTAATNSSPVISSQTAINSPIVTTQPRPLGSASIAPSDHSTPRHSSSRHPLALNEHYNLPLSIPKPWSSVGRTWTHAQLERERTDFFETRVTGRPEIWGAIRTTTELLREGELATAQGIIDAAGITLPSGNLVDGCYDEAGNLYKIPEVIVLDPLNVVHEREKHARDSGIDGATMVGISEAKSNTKGDDEDDGHLEDKEAIEQRREAKGKSIIRDGVKVRCRLSDRGGPDVVVTIGKTQTVGTLIKRVEEEANIASTSHIRIAYLGHIFEERQTLAAQGWKEGHVINALVTGQPPESS